MTRPAHFRRIGAHGVACFLALAFASVGCGGGSGAAADGAAGAAGATGAGGTTGGTPLAMCTQLVTTLCIRLNDECKLSDGGVPDCEKFQNVAFGCDRATSAAFADCLKDVQGLSCAGLFPASGLVLPGTCNDPLNIPPSDAQTKCVNLVGVVCDPVDVCANVTPVQTTDLTTCLQNGSDQIGCQFAVAVGPTYAQCLTDLCATADAGVPDGGTGPASCNGVIQGPM
ncbi:MAG TPA: hypothetical protein VG319_12760 [Polyangia bacterium]|jgi:hypothetical protein|nr:hypothetical protein [Polyangia bacterium]